jgi:uncharacterized membrane protein
MNSIAIVLVLLALLLEFLPVVTALRWNREDRAPPSPVPLIPWLLYIAACILWKQAVLVKLIGFLVLTALHVFCQSFVARRGVDWRARRRH